VVTGTYSDGSTKTEAVTSANISGYDSMSVRTQTIIVSINGLTAYFNVTVTAPVLDSIQVIALPSKTVYVTGEAFNISGLTVLGTYTDSTMGLQPVAAGQISGYNATSAGTQTLTVTMGTVSTTFTVTVCGLDHIRVIQLPSKVVYAQGESLDPTGIEVQGIYIGAGISTERIISGSALSISGFNSTQTGPQNLTVSAHGKTTNFIVFVDD
jgi:hypothetical protein